MLCSTQRSGAISVKHANKQFFPERLTRLQQPTTSLRTVYAVIAEYDNQVHVQVTSSAKECARELLQLVTRRMPHRRTEELQATLRLVLEDKPVLLENTTGGTVRIVLMSGHQCRCGGDGGVVWSIAKEGETKFYWEEDNTLTVTQFLSTILHPVSDVIHYTLELDTPTAVMGQAQCGSVRMAFSKLLKLRSSCCKT